MISEAIWEDKKWTKGSSRTEIKKFIVQNYDVDEEKLKENLSVNLNKMLDTDSKIGHPCLKKHEHNYKLTPQWRKAWKKKAGIRPQKRKKKKKDPDAPKNPRNSYLWYLQDVRESLKEKYPEKDHREITTLVAEEWKNLDKKKKKKYENKALEDKARYEKELKDYKKKKRMETSEESSSDSRPVKSKKKKRRDSSDSESGKSDRKKRRKKVSASSSESSVSKDEKKKKSDDKTKRRTQEDSSESGSKGDSKKPDKKEDDKPKVK
jgi:hypothetical protein